MAAWIGFAVQIIMALPSIITGVEAAFGKKSGQGAAKWIAVESALSQPIQELAKAVSSSIPNKDAAAIATEVSKFTKSINDAIVAFYNSVGWPTPSAPTV